MFLCADLRELCFCSGISSHIPNLPGYKTGGRKKLCWSIYYTYGFSVKGRLWPLLHQGLPLGEMLSSISTGSALFSLGATTGVLRNGTKTAQQEMAPCNLQAGLREEK